MKQFCPAVVAVGLVVLALARGGYGAEVQAGFCTIVWAFVLAGLAGGWLPRSRVRGPVVAAGTCLVALAVLTGLSATWSKDAGVAFDQLPRAAAYAGLFALVALSAVREDIRVWLGAVAAATAVVGALALGSRLAPGSFATPDLPRFLPSARARLSYPVNYWNGLAALLALGIVVQVGMAADAARRATRAAAAAVVAPMGLALYLTSSRGGVAALAVGLLALVALSPARLRVLLVGALTGTAAAVLIALAERRGSLVDGRAGPLARDQGHELLLIVLLAVAVVAAARWALDVAGSRVVAPRWAHAVALTAIALVLAGAVVAANPGHRIDQFTKPPAPPPAQAGFVSTHLASADGSGRWQFWGAGLRALRHEPVRGVGAGGYEAWWARHGRLSYFIRDAHSLFVQTAAELGVPGLLLVLGFFAAAVLSLAGLRGTPGWAPGTVALAALACGAASAAVDWTWQLPAVFAPVVVVAGALAGPTEAARPRSRRRVLPLVAVAAAAIVVGCVAWVGQDELRRSRHDAGAGALAAAAGHAKTAARVEPWAAAPQAQLALVREQGGDLRGARAALAQALGHAPGDWRLWTIAVRLDLRAGRLRQARRALERARELNPRSSLLMAPDRPRSRPAG